MRIQQSLIEARWDKNVLMNIGGGWCGVARQDFFKPKVETAGLGSVVGGFEQEDAAGDPGPIFTVGEKAVRTQPRFRSGCSKAAAQTDRGVRRGAVAENDESVDEGGEGETDENVGPESLETGDVQAEEHGNACNGQDDPLGNAAIKRLFLFEGLSADHQYVDEGRPLGRCVGPVQPGVDEHGGKGLIKGAGRDVSSGEHNAAETKHPCAEEEREELDPVESVRGAGDNGEHAENSERPERALEPGNELASMEGLEFGADGDGRGFRGDDGDDHPYEADGADEDGAEDCGELYRLRSMFGEVDDGGKDSHCSSDRDAHRHEEIERAAARVHRVAAPGEPGADNCDNGEEDRDHNGLPMRYAQFGEIYPHLIAEGGMKETGQERNAVQNALNSIQQV